MATESSRWQQSTLIRGTAIGVTVSQGSYQIVEFRSSGNIIQVLKQQARLGLVS